MYYFKLFICVFLFISTSCSQYYQNNGLSEVKFNKIKIEIGKTSKKDLINKYGPPVFESVFKTDAGAEVLKYLRQITIEAVAGSEISDNQLRHIEGQRYIVGLIQRRLNKGRSQNIIKEKQDVR